MSTVLPLSGACLCGAVRIEILERPDHAPEACHCTYCRKQSGHVLAAVNVKRDTLRIHGADAVTWYKSSDKVERGFCSICGSTLFWKPTIDALDRLLGRTLPDREWHPRDGRIIELGLHRTIDGTLGDEVMIAIAACSMAASSDVGF